VRTRLDPEELEIMETGEGVRLRLRVKPGARTDEISATYAGALKVSVTAPPERGRANAAVAALLARALGVSRSKVVVTSGHSSQDKIVSVLGLRAAEVRARLG
jgi:uncharacterized protein (TIGR00251 family)